MRPLRMATLFCAVLSALALVPAAQAAFRGADGLLAVVPAHGGVVLTDARGRSVTRVCTDAALCGTPASARFAPDGRDLAFVDRATGSPGAVAADGTCLWCLLGPQLTRLRGVAASFTADGLGVALAAPSGVWRVAMTGGAARRLTASSATDVAWAANGAFAFVHAGEIWVVGRGRAARFLASGTGPSFSPSGRTIVFTRRGWIWAISAGGGRPRRLVRGSAAVFSPDGRSLAFIGRGDRVYVSGTRGRHARLVPGVRARALDWQPVPRHVANRCPVPAGATLLAQSAEAVVTVNPANAFAPWSGCLRATGKRRALAALTTAGSGYTNTLSGLQLAGRFVGFVLNYSDKYGGCLNSVHRVDLGNGASIQPYQGCYGIDGLGLDSSGFLAWRAFEQVAGPHPLIAAACASSTVCVAGDGLGNAAASTTPSTGGWTLSHVAPSFAGMTCARGSTFCVGWVGGNVMTSTDPTSTAWSAPTTIDPNNQIADIACPSSSLCVAVDGAGNVLTDNGGTWSSTSLDAGHFLDGVSCPTTTFCVAVGQGGDVLVWNGSAWTKNPQPAESNVFAIGGVACPATNLCVSTDPNGHILTTHNPSLPGAWAQTSIPGAGFLSQHEPVCPSTTLCVVPDGGGNLLVSTAPGSATPAWTSIHLASSPNAIATVACAPASTVCLATDEDGNVLSTTNPTGAWTSTPVDVPGCGACVAEQVYVQDDRGRQTVDTAQPGPGNVIGNIALSGNSTTVTWTHAGVPERFGLR
jgi:hypothetical protein